MATIGIDISQIVYEGTGVARHVRNLVKSLVSDKENTYVLFGSTLRQKQRLISYSKEINAINPKVVCRFFPFPPTLLTFIWNRIHIIPIKWLIGNVDIFFSSDWLQPPLDGAIGVTTIHDLAVYRYPESFTQKIVKNHKRKLFWSMKECKLFFCDSEATKNDLMNILNVPNERIKVIYPGL